MNLKTLIEEARLSGIYNTEASGEEPVTFQQASVQTGFAHGGMKA